MDERTLHNGYMQLRRPTREFAAELHVSPRTLTANLRAHGLPIRQPGELSRRYQLVDSTPFAEPQTDGHAYWLGFLAADGCVYTADGRYLVRLRLKVSDLHHVRNFAQVTGSNAPVTISKAGYAQVEYFDR